jgi:hypothetical protein
MDIRYRYLVYNIDDIQLEERDGAVRSTLLMPRRLYTSDESWNIFIGDQNGVLTWILNPNTSLLMN